MGVTNFGSITLDDTGVNLQATAQGKFGIYSSVNVSTGSITVSTANALNTIIERSAGHVSNTVTVPVTPVGKIYAIVSTTAANTLVKTASTASNTITVAATKSALVYVNSSGNLVRLTAASAQELERGAEMPLFSSRRKYVQTRTYRRFCFNNDRKSVVLYIGRIDRNEQIASWRCGNSRARRRERIIGTEITCLQGVREGIFRMERFHQMCHEP